MWGAIIGDLAGSVYEFEQTRQVSRVDVEELITDDSFFTDDTILTMAILHAILDCMISQESITWSRAESYIDVQKYPAYEAFLRKYGEEFSNYHPDKEPYFSTTFSPHFMKWLREAKRGSSSENGALMRISPVAHLFRTPEEILFHTISATIPTHCSLEAIECAKVISLVIFYAKQGIPKEDILKRLGLTLHFTPICKFNTNCYGTLRLCLYSAFSSKNFEESVRKVISYGGSTGTNACITGSMAEALYGIPEVFIQQAKEKIPDAFVKMLEKAYLVEKRVYEGAL